MLYSGVLPTRLRSTAYSTLSLLTAACTRGPGSFPAQSLSDLSLAPEAWLFQISDQAQTSQRQSVEKPVDP